MGYVSSDENDACFIAMEAGIIKVITATYTLMKMMCFSLEAGITKVATATYPVMKMTRVSLQWKEGARNNNRAVHPTLIAVKPAIFSSTVTCGAIKSVHPTSIAMTLELF